MAQKSSTAIKIEPGAGTQDWRATFPAHNRQKIVNSLVGHFKKQVHPPSNPGFLEKITHLVRQFEEKAFQNATTKEKYESMITKKMNLYSCSSTATSSSRMSGVSGNTVECRVPLDICPNTQGEMPVDQSSEHLLSRVCQRQELPNEMLKDKVQDTNSCSTRIQSNICNPQYRQEEQCVTSQTNQLLSVVPLQSYQLPLEQVQKNTLFQQNQQLGQQLEVSEPLQWPNGKPSMPTAFQQPLSQQRAVSGVKLQQKIDPNLHLHQHLTHQQVGITAAEMNVQKIMQSVPLHQPMGSQKHSGLSQLAVQQRLTSPADLHQNQRVADQQNRFQSQSLQTGPLSAPKESKSLSENANIVDWNDAAYRKIQEMKKQYGSHLVHLRKQLMSLCNNATGAEQLSQHKNRLEMTEKCLRFLKLQRSQIQSVCKEKLDQYHQRIINFLSSFGKKNPASEQQAQLLKPPADHSQMSQLHMNRGAKLKFCPVNLTANLHTSSPNSLPNVSGSCQYGSGMGSGQRNNLCHFQQSVTPSAQNILDTPLQNNISCNTILNAVDSSLNHHSIVPPPNRKQHGQPQIIQHVMQHMPMQNIQADVIKGIGAPETPHRIPVPAIHCHPHITSPQMSQNSSPWINRQTLSSLSKSGTPLQSSSSPAAIVLTSSPLSPSPMLLNQETESSGVSSTIMSENNRNPKPNFVPTQADKHTEICDQSSVTTGLVASPILTESTCLNGNQQSSVSNQPLQRLIKAVERLPPGALSAAVHEISSVVSMVDMIADTEVGSDSRGALGEDLASQTRSHLLASTPARDVNHQTSAMTSGTSFSVSTIDPPKDEFCNFHLTATSRTKRQRTLANDFLLDEIKSINQSLVETMIYLDSNDAVTLPEDCEGTIIRCSYQAVALHENIKQYALSLMFPVLSLLLFIPSNYPNSSPVILGRMPLDLRHGIGDSEDPREKTMMRFSEYLRNLSEPMSLGEMARTWDGCARAVVYENAKLIGGEGFSSRYGTWKSCITA